MPRTVLARRRPLVLTAALAVALAMVVPPATAAAAPTALPVPAAASPAPVVQRLAAAPTVTLVGDLQSELGCPGDWAPDCSATRLSETAAGVYTGTFEVPAGQWKYKVALNGSWDESYGAGGVKGGGDIPLALAGAASLVVRYDNATHLITVSPAVSAAGVDQGGQGAGRVEPALRPHPRALLLRDDRPVRQRATRPTTPADSPATR